MRYTICLKFTNDKKDASYWFHCMLCNRVEQMHFLVPHGDSREYIYLPVFESRVEAEMYSRILNYWFHKHRKDTLTQVFIKKFDTPDMPYKIVKDGKYFTDKRDFVKKHGLCPKYFEAKLKKR